MLGQGGGGSYIHRGIHDNVGHSHDDTRVPTRLGTRCMPIYVSNDTREHALDLVYRGSYRVQFIAIRRVILILSTSSKQRALTNRDEEIAYRGVHFNINGGVVNSGGGMFLSGWFGHIEY